MVVSPQEALRVVLTVIRSLSQLGVPYAIDGSLASSMHGVPRSTRDADLITNLRPENIQPFVTAVSRAFYVSPERVAQAVLERSSFSMAHRATGIKIDISVLNDDPLQAQNLIRRRTFHVPDEPGITLQVTSAENIVLQKLRWYQTGNRVSDQQWNDILGVLKVQRKSLDFEYLREWADRTGVEDLLRQAYEDAGIDPAV
jgi:hypothetical protein